MVEMSRGGKYEILCEKSDEELLSLKDDSNTDLILHILYDRYEKKSLLQSQVIIEGCS